MITYFSQDKYNSLRAEYDFFRFQRYDYTLDNEALTAKFYFSLDDKYYFYPSFQIPLKNFYNFSKTTKDQLDTLIFNIGMIELISYWKLACPRKVYIKPHFLDDEQVKWWKKLYYNGLGEFFYLNNINDNIDDFMEIIVENDYKCKKITAEYDDKCLVPVGGGKDSVVTLESLKNKIPIIPLIINPRAATTNCVSTAGFSSNQTVIIKRQLDPTMLKMNNEGFLNGHTPFSALLAFYTLLIAHISNSKYIALSNESSANEPTVPNTEINHQYSKSIQFENDFREYVDKYISSDIQYFSFLRPLNELQIAMLFSKNHQYFDVFKSCNAGSKNDVWCGKCPKCLFTWIILTPFIDQEILTKIFGGNLLKNNELIHLLKQLDGSEQTKPFECVGTVDEVRACLKLLTKKNITEDYILQNIDYQNDKDISDILNQYDDNNNLPDIFEKILKSNL